MTIEEKKKFVWILEYKVQLEVLKRFKDIKRYNEKINREFTTFDLDHAIMNISNVLKYNRNRLKTELNLKPNKEYLENFEKYYKSTVNIYSKLYAHTLCFYYNVCATLLTDEDKRWYCDEAHKMFELL